MEEVALVPAGALAFAFDTGFNRCVLAQQRHRQSVEQRHVVNRLAVTLPHAVLIEGNVQYPMQAVLNAPVLANRMRQALGPRRQAADEVTYLLGFAPGSVVNALP